MKTRRARVLALALVTLAASVGVSFSGVEQAAAVPCCGACDAGYDSCVGNCNGSSACEQKCTKYFAICMRHCSQSC